MSFIKVFVAVFFPSIVLFLQKTQAKLNASASVTNATTITRIQNFRDRFAAYVSTTFTVFYTLILLEIGVAIGVY